MKQAKKSTALARKRAQAKPGKKLAKKFDWNEMAGIGLRGGKKPKRITKPEKDIVWGD